MNKYWITDSRFKYIGILLFLIWAGFIIFFYLKADEITKDPCSICAKTMGQNVFCTTQTPIPVTRTYYSNGTISDNSEEARSRAYREADKMYKNANSIKLMNSINLSEYFK